jgi:hypothetical protein
MAKRTDGAQPTHIQRSKVPTKKLSKMTHLQAYCTKFWQSSGVSNQSGNKDTSRDLMKKKDEGFNWILKKDCILPKADKF